MKILYHQESVPKISVCAFLITVIFANDGCCQPQANSTAYGVSRLEPSSHPQFPVPRTQSSTAEEEQNDDTFTVFRTKARHTGDERNGKFNAAAFVLSGSTTLENKKPESKNHLTYNLPQVKRGLTALDYLIDNGVYVKEKGKHHTLLYQQNGDEFEDQLDSSDENLVDYAVDDPEDSEIMKFFRPDVTEGHVNKKISVGISSQEAVDNEDVIVGEGASNGGGNNDGLLISEKEELRRREAMARLLSQERRLLSPKEGLSENRNLSRKRRTSLLSEYQRRQHGFPRRRRRRKRRHRHLGKKEEDNLTETNNAEEGLFGSRRAERFLNSDSPSYVITSAREVKKDWCRTMPLRQKVTEKNCRSKFIMNNFCYGQCNSFFIPHPGRTGSDAAFQSCAFCKPHRPKWTTVTLHCPGQNPPKRDTKVLKVESCRCITEVLK